MRKFRCNRCCDTGLATNPLAILLCFLAAAVYCGGIYLFFQRSIDAGGMPIPRMPAILFAGIVFGPPAGLIWLGTSNVFKRPCPNCSR
ncbi:MAG: hypothetical protein AMXMBFR47_19920 [Planctomycetota bacterium]